MDNEVTTKRERNLREKRRSAFFFKCIFLLCIVAVAMPFATEASSTSGERSQIEQNEEEIVTTVSSMTSKVTTKSSTTKKATTTTTTATTTTVTTEMLETATEPEESGISNEDFIVLCNLVAHEYGSNEVPIAEKALVLEVVYNRIASERFPNTLAEVLLQEGQFVGAEAYFTTEFSAKVTDSVKEAVEYFFLHREEYGHGYTGFYGDGTRNYFY